MENTRLSGPGAGVVKYDLLTALSVYGLNGSAADHLSMSRLAALITARYNWRTDDLTMGQAEMSRLWGIGERTVKREVKRWLTEGFLTCRQPGVRGRVAKYRLNIARICEATEPIWHLVGPDFADRMAALRPATAQVIRLQAHPQNVSNKDELAGWDAVRSQLADRFPAQYPAWIEPLEATLAGDELTLDAKSLFAAEYASTHFGRDIAEAVAAEWGASVKIVIRGPENLKQHR